MGTPKALLRHPRDGRTFVAHTISTLDSGGVAEVAVVGRPDDAELRDEVSRSSAAAFLENPSSELGQLSSVLVGIQYAEHRGADAVMMLPVDTPLIRADTVRALLDAFAAGGQPVARAVHGGEHGHPVIVAASLFPELRAADPSLGARAVLRRDPSRVRNVEVDDPGVLRDFDVPEDYRRLLNGQS